MSADAPSSNLSLQSALHAATRSVHTTLNKTITARLPLCLPPYSSDPTAYYLGMLTFGHIFLTFERAITHVLEAPPSGVLESRNIQLLKALSTDGLPRGDALKHDLEILSKRLQAQNPAMVHIEARVRDQAIKDTSRIFDNIKSRPHLALAYTWTMYLAMFNGGRWLYKQLESPGPRFWLDEKLADEDYQTIQALSFWRFDTNPQDPNAEELKLAFKKHFELASEKLSTEAQDEVVKEAVSLFDLCLSMIGNLDTLMADLQNGTPQISTGAACETELPPDAGMTSSVWHTVRSTLLGPAYRILNSTWARPMKGEVKAVD